MTIYEYEELKNKALASGAAEDVNALGEWFQLYGYEYWNGEYFRVEGGLRLYPIYEEVEEDEFEITEYELK